MTGAISEDPGKNYFSDVTNASPLSTTSHFAFSVRKTPQLVKPPGAMGNPIATPNDTSNTTANGDGNQAASTAPESIHDGETTQTGPPAPTNQSQTPSNPSDLPPAALDLASKLFDLARDGDTPALRQYVSAGIPPNLTNHSGDTLLMLAAYHGHADTVRMLLERGSDPNVKNDRSQSPIAGAVFKGWDEVVKALFEGGADIHEGQPNAVDCARMFKREAILNLFGVPLGEGITMNFADGRLS